MKTKSILIIALTFLLNSAMAQKLVVQVKPEGSKDWFYLNEKGEKYFDFGLEKSYPFSENGLAPVFNPIKKEFYFINLKGESLKADIDRIRLMEIFGFYITGFKDGMVAVKQNKLWGFMNTEGKLVIPLKYTDVSEFDHGYASVERDNKNIIINKKGEEIIITDPQIFKLKPFSEGMAPFYTPEKKAGFINTEGKIIIQPKFNSLGYFVNGLAWAKTTDMMVGYIDPQGNWVIEPKFLSAGDFDKESGLARIKKTDEKTAYVNRKGEIIEMKDGDGPSDFSDGLAYAHKGDKVGFYDNTGKWVIEPQFEEVKDFHNGYAAARKDKLWGLIDKKGNWVFKPIYSGVREMVLVKD